MDEAQELYATLLEASRKAFACQLFTASYHGLSGALCCAVRLKDKEKLKEVEQLAREQYELLRASHCQSAAMKEPVELSLYVSLLQIVRTRLLFISK